MLKNTTVCDVTGKSVHVRLFSKGEIFVVTKGNQTVFESNLEQAAREIYETTVKLMPKGKRPPKRKKLITFSGGLPTLGKK